MSLLAGIGIALFTLALWLGASRSSHGPERFWIAAWGAAIASGGLLLRFRSFTQQLAAGQAVCMLVDFDAHLRRVR